MVKVAIIGGGPAGYEAAFSARTSGAEVILIEDTGIGGACVLFDCVPSKTFIASTGLRTELRRAGNLGVSVTHDHDIDLTTVNSRVKELAQQQSIDIKANLEAAGVRIINGKAKFSEKYKEYYPKHCLNVFHQDDSQEDIVADIVLIATGASPRVLPGAEPDGTHVLNWRDVYNLEKLPTDLIVVGSGVTGSEFVHVFTEMGVNVTVLSSTDRMLPREDKDAAIVLEEVLASRGVNLIRDAKATKAVRVGDGVEVTLDNGDVISGSHALMTVGSTPNTENIGIENVGIKVNHGGYIAVDRVSRTSVPGIYAAGDCTGVLPLASVAAMQGRVAVNHAMGEPVLPIKLRTVASAVFTRPEISSVGVPQELIDDGTYSARTVMLPLSSNPRAKMQGLKRGFVKIFCRPATGTVIGGVIVAPNASELITVVSMAVENQMKVQDLANTFMVYPSLSGSVIEAARRLIKHDDLE